MGVGSVSGTRFDIDFPSDAHADGTNALLAWESSDQNRTCNNVVRYALFEKNLASQIGNDKVFAEQCATPNSDGEVTPGRNSRSR